MMVDSNAPISGGRMRSPSTARPMDTPACGIRARPRYFLTSGVLPASAPPIVAPRYLPRIRTAK